MKIKTSELTSAALDWAVAKCEGYTDLRRNPHRFNDELIMNPPHAPRDPIWFVDLAYSTDWAQGGPIIEREGIYLKARNDAKEWEAGALSMNRQDNKPGPLYSGPTPLIAAMRCYVTSKLGDEVDVPEKLCTSPSSTQGNLSGS